MWANHSHLFVRGNTCLPSLSSILNVKISGGNVCAIRYAVWVVRYNVERAVQQVEFVKYSPTYRVLVKFYLYVFSEAHLVRGRLLKSAELPPYPIAQHPEYS